MSKTVDQLTETTTLATNGLLHVVDKANDQDKKMKAAKFWNAKPYGEFFIAGSTNSTSIAAAGIGYNITTGGTVIPTVGQLNAFTFDAANGRLTYTGEEDIVLKMDLSITWYHLGSGVKNAQISIYINSLILVKTIAQDEINANASSTKYRQTSVTGLWTLSKNDYVELYVTNHTDTSNIVPYILNFNVTAL